MKPAPVILFSAIALIASSASAATLSMRFADGGNEITMGPSDTAIVEIVWTMRSTDSSKSRLTGLDLRFAVAGQPAKYVAESTTAVCPVCVGWETWILPPALLDDEFFYSSGDPNGSTGPSGTSTEQPGIVVGSFVIRKIDFAAGDSALVFRHEDRNDFLPAAYNAALLWTLRFQSEPIGINQYDLGEGNPGDAGPQWDPYHGYETYAPLIIHNVPEASAVGLLGLGAVLTRRRRLRRARASLR